MEASALTHASRRGLLARRSPLLKLQGDEKLIAMARAGNPGAFETMVDRYQPRLLGFCRQMLGSTEDAEDVLQEVFVNAYRAMLADEREINLRPWLYRIARNRCLNYLRKPKADAQESMDMVPEVDAASTAERVHNREEFRQIISDVNKLPETQRAALLLREMDALSYEEIAAAMETTVPSVKSLLVRARISLAEASQARLLTCGEVRVELSEAAEGLRKVSAPVRRHVRECDECADFRSQIRSNEKALAALFPVGPLIAFKGFIASKLGLGTGSAGAGAGAAGAGAAGAGAGAVGGGVAALGGGSAASGLGALGGAIGTKAAAGVVTAALLTAGAVEVKETTNSSPVTPAPTTARTYQAPTESAPAISKGTPAPVATAPVKDAEVVENTPLPAPTEPAAEAPAEPAPAPQPTAPAEDEEVAGQSGAEEEVTIGEAESGAIGTAKASEETPGAPGGGSVVVVTTAPSSPPPSEPAPAPESSPPPPPPAEESAPPAEEPAPATVEVPPVSEAGAP
ncbi:MAG TPA: RNA polymerase sigma factor [Solirubrobacterales bacterium]|nr:RNA polymerase sigma factor [Solirubrobacterales bacterium]